MDFAQTDTQRMIADMLGRMLREQNEFSVRRERLMQASPQRLHLWPSFVETGIVGVLVPESAGGFGGAGRDIAVVAYAVGRSLTVEPLLGVMASSRILIRADTEIATTELEQLTAGERLIILAHDEGFDPFAPPSIKAVPHGNNFRLDGVKPVVAHADVADAFIVTATLPDGSVGCFLLEADGQGVTRETYRMMDAAGGGTLTLTAAAGQALALGDDARTAIIDAVEWGIFGMCSEAVGIIDALNETTREYLRTRVQFGVPIGSFQALQHRSADMFIAGEEAGVAVDALAEALDGPVDALRSARISALKVIADTAGRKVGHEAVQMHGGVGVSDELIVSHYMRRLATIRAQLGSAELHRGRFHSLAA